MRINISRRTREMRLYACLIALNSVVFVILNRAGVPYYIQEPIGAVILVVWLAGVFSERFAIKYERNLNDSV